MKIKTTKQSMIDWQVTADGNAHAWISKISYGYEVAFFDQLLKKHTNPYWFPTFKEAKEFATKLFD